MQLKAAETLALRLMAKHKLKGWKFSFDNSTSTCGVCKKEEKSISLSIHFVETEGLAEVGETILHEIAHALAPDEWAERKRRIEVPKRRYSLSYEMKMLRRLRRSTPAEAEKIRERLSATEVKFYTYRTRLDHGKKWKTIARRIGCTGNKCSGGRIVISRRRAKYVGTCPNCGQSVNLMDRRQLSCAKCNPDRFDNRYVLSLTTRNGKPVKRPLTSHERWDKERATAEKATKGMSDEQRNQYSTRQHILRDLRHRRQTEKQLCYGNRWMLAGLRSLLDDRLVIKEGKLYRIAPRKKVAAKKR
jgi:predicted SprT family Zn-dependent metalloprotease